MPLTKLYSVDDRKLLGPEYTIGRKYSTSWKDMLDSSTGIDSQEKIFNSSDGQQQNWPSQWSDFGGNIAENKSNYYTSESNLSLQLSAARQFLLGSDNPLVSPTSTSLPQEVQHSRSSGYSSGTSVHEAKPDYYTFFDQESNPEIPLVADSSLTITQKQSFTICEISPEWGYATEDTKVCSMNFYIFSCSFSNNVFWFFHCEGSRFSNSMA